MILKYHIGDLVDYINWSYFFHAWGLPSKMSGIANVHRCQSCQESWVSRFQCDDTIAARDAVKLFNSAMTFLGQIQRHVEVQALFRLYEASSHNEDIILYDESGEEVCRLPMLRQQVPSRDGFCLCLADFITAESSGKKDKIGLFATSVGTHSPAPSASGSVRPEINLGSDLEGKSDLLLQTLSDRLAEAAAERLHEQVRKDPAKWGYASDENLTIRDLHECRYVGIRPAVGYPCMPDLSLNFLLDELLGMGRIGIRLTEHGMMIPHASVSGLMVSNPHARYFSVGEVSDDQVADYAHRRHKDIDETKKFLGLL